MHKSQPIQESNQALLARVKKEMDEPRMAESTRSPHQPPWPPGRGRAVASRSEILASPTGVAAPRAPSPRSRVNTRWIAHTELAAAPGHPCYQKLNELLEAE